MSGQNKSKKSPRWASYFPQFSRIFAALFLFFLFFAFFLLPSGEKLKLMIAPDNKNPKVHLQLAKEYEKVNDLKNARRKILIGLSFAPENEELKNALTEVENILGQPAQVKEEIQTWEKIAQDFPGYRDAYLK